MSTEPNKGQDASGGDGTQKPDLEVKSSPGEENDKNTTVQLNSSDQSSQDQNEKEGGTQRNLEAERGKIESLEKERNKYSQDLATLRKQADEYKRVVDVVNKQFAGNPQAYEKFRQDWLAAGNQDYGSYDQLYGGSPQTNIAGGQSTITPAAATEQLIDADKLVERAKREIKQEQEMEELESALGGFLDKNPDLDIRTLQPYSPEYQQKLGHLQKVAKLAATYREIYPTLIKEELIERANRSIDMDGALQREREIGKLAGRKEVYTTEAGNVGSLAGGTATDKSAESVELTSEEFAHYEDILKSSPSAAKIFAENIKKGRESK